MLKKLGFDNKPEYVKKVLDCPDKLTQEFECLEKLRVVYDEVVARLKSNQFKVHGLAGGSSIMFNGRLRCVPKGVSKIWAQLADDEGNFKWMNDVDGALAQAKSQADQRQGNEGLAVVSIFFGSYRDNQTKAMYKEISGLLAS
ncbi:hypothetical protein DA717_12680 [Piscirickettsiaceae bacterium NZ-RLO2]|nr:hypothetical protein DA717_12680 [Piscirickettsiaceae bacterium NZ-RLO2]